MEIINGIINIEQLPVVKERFEEISEAAKEKVSKALSLSATEENKQAIKKMRAELRKDFSLFEDARKAVNREIEERLKPFNDAYKKYISDIYKPADCELKDKIDSIDSELIEEKKASVKEYFTEYALFCGIDFISFENANINVTLSASMKSLKEQAKDFVDRIVSDLKIIGNMEHCDEVLYEYRKSLSASDAIALVSERHKALDKPEEKEVKEVSEETKSEEAKEDAPLEPPETAREERIYKCKFTVFTNLEKLKKLKEFLTKEGIDYEQH